MAPTTSAEADVRAFAAEFGSSPNVQRMLALCEARVITWDQAAGIARDALAAGLTAVAGDAR